MKLLKARIKNFKSIKDSGDIYFSDDMYILAGQNESGKSSILEALQAFETGIFPDDCVNFEEFQKGNETESVTCTYKIINTKEFANELKDELKKEFKIEDENFINTKIIIEKLNEFPISKKYNDSNENVEIITSNVVIGIIQSAIFNKEIEKDNTKNLKQLSEPFINFKKDDKNSKLLAEILFSLAPEIVLFNDFSDLLPDEISIEDLENENKEAKGYSAVKNIEEILDVKFVEIAKRARNVGVKNSMVAKQVENLSISFQKDWRQKIYGNNDVNIIFKIENDDDGEKKVYFFIQTKDNEPLLPKKRSKGMIWFLSAWLDLKARENGNKLVILYDEPGLYLHIKAHKDILNVFKSLTKNGHQVIYSTHSPSLINIERLSNIGLVLNTEKNGTIVESLTTSKLNTKFKKDALQPIAEAMGLNPLNDFSVLSEKNVIIEGLSDFWYLQSMASLLKKETNYKFVPSVGIKGNKIDHIISFCIGYGLNWLLVMDNGENPKATRNRLMDELFDGRDELTDKKIFLNSFSEIEDMFSANDLSLVDSKIKKDDNRKSSNIIGSRKIVFAKMFSEKVNNNEITKSKLAKSTLQNFEIIFKWIEEKFKAN